MVFGHDHWFLFRRVFCFLNDHDSWSSVDAERFCPRGLHAFPQVRVELDDELPHLVDHLSLDLQGLVEEGVRLATEQALFLVKELAPVVALIAFVDVNTLIQVLLFELVLLVLEVVLNLLLLGLDGWLDDLHFGLLGLRRFLVLCLLDLIFRILKHLFM